MCDIVERLRRHIRVTGETREDRWTWRPKDKTWKWYIHTDFDMTQQFHDGSVELHMHSTWSAAGSVVGQMASET